MYCSVGVLFGLYTGIRGHIGGVRRIIRLAGGITPLQIPDLVIENTVVGLFSGLLWPLVLPTYCWYNDSIT